MAEFRARWPGIHLAINEATQDKIEQQLIADELDVGLGYAGAHIVDLQRIPLMQEALSLMVNNNHPLAKRTSLILADLDALPLVLLNTGFTTRTEIDHHLHKQGVAPSIVAESNTLGVVLELIEHAPLAALLPDTLARRHATLIALKIEPAFAERSGVMLMRQGSIHAATQALKSLLTEMLKDGWGATNAKC
nr:LysR substrate-binding domain-containing protein [Pantoea rodasii]